MIKYVSRRMVDAENAGELHGGTGGAKTIGLYLGKNPVTHRWL